MAEAVEPLVASIAALENEVAALREQADLKRDPEDPEVRTALAILLLGMYQQTGDPTDLPAVFKQLNINP